MRARPGARAAEGAAAPRGLGTELRHLVDLLDGGVQRSYDALGLAFRPRFTPVVRALLGGPPRSIREIARHAGLTHSAASQTAAEMRRLGLLRSAPGPDARERRVRLGARAAAMLPALERQWATTAAAADALDRELGGRLRSALRQAIAALERVPFEQRIARAAGRRRRPS